MVVIEPCSDPDTTRNRTNTEIPEHSNAQTEESSREDDGFETASDGESDGQDRNPDSSKPEEPTPEEPTAEQLQQKALAQANDAKAEGNKLFGAGQYEDALSQYAIALQIAPEVPSSSEVRSICHANSAACFSKLGRYDDAIKECTKALELNPTYMKALVRRAEAHEKLEHFEEAITDMKKILELDSSNVQARRGIQRLEPLAAEKREKMKEEMIGKLKEMGNSVLGRFGMSVDNFKAVKDPNTGSYSISFQR
ncbi:tetratricopeptide repeat protein 1-like protein isoform X1 [Cinnamomum micranthum f. kanehirae]|uniref:Tetratricopeptide repeat protein 1-like protein isoform X1 n=1 Tax=Cinnamomum micranthum f. kanehirae TaxID=337451 RepID=A0A3S3MFB0_9MAGN|nr:tetratricopeptide repeat protein 1-like protein isoform X1 [Cinnamomum micranthum f. kanehirae]